MVTSQELTVVDEVRGMLKDKFRQVSVEREIDGEGMGKRIVVPTDEIPSGDSIRKAEDALTEEQGAPVRLIFLNPKEIESSKIIWQIVIRPKEKHTSEVGKLMFRAEMQDLIPLGVNIAWMQERAASVWEEDPQKAFAPNPEGAAFPGQEEESQTLSPRTQLPTAEKALNRSVKTQLGANA